MELTKCAKSFVPAALILSLPWLLISLGGCAQTEPKVTVAPSGPSQLADDIVGAWVLVGTPGEVGEPPAAGGRFKFRAGGHWLITQADPNSHEVIYHHGGTYTLNGDEYAEKIEYANENTNHMINRTLKFKVKVEGDTYTQTGIGNPYSEVWKRVK